ncbi:MAG: porin [Bacteroidales bacterium]|nr:porin [Bacteroidales bacterium]
MRRKITLVIFALLAVTLMWESAYAQQDHLLNLQAEVRVDYQYEGVDGEKVVDNTGFKGKYLNLILNGKISKKITYSYRQRLNKSHSSQSFFDATDWIYLIYSPCKHWDLSAGKQVVSIGGFEYDRAPIDLYTCSEFWNNIPCYQFGVSASYLMNSGRNKFHFQVCESPFRSVCNDDVYAYNFMWYGIHDWFNTAWSVNMIEYEKGKFINYIALGNYLRFGNLHFYLDFMNRATSHQTFLFKDCSFMGEVSYNVGEKFKLFGKVTYDVNKTDNIADFCVLPGTELTLYGGGVEYFPLKGNNNLRLHATYFYSTGTNGNPYGTMQDKGSVIDVGLKWKMNILKLERRKNNDA